MKATTVLVFALSCLCMVAFSGCSRGLSERPLSQAEIQEAARFYGGNTEFTATQTVTTKTPAGKDNPPTESAIAFSGGKWRDVEMFFDYKPTVVGRPDRNKGYIIWAGDLKCVVEEALRFPNTGQIGEPSDLSPTLSFGLVPVPHSVKGKSDIGEETVNGHPCVKCRVITQEENGTIEWTTWEATDLNRFPIRAEYLRSGQILRVEFTNVQIEKPDPALFEPPKGYKRFKSRKEAGPYLMKKAFQG